MDNNRTNELVGKAIKIFNPDGSGKSFSGQEILSILETFPPANFIGQAVPAIISTQKGMFLYVGEGIKELVGYSSEDFMSHSMQDLLPRLHTPEHGAVVGELFMKAVQYIHANLMGKMDLQINLDHVFICRSGDKKRVLAHSWPLQWDVAGNLTLLGMYFVDISNLGKGGAPSVNILSNGMLLQEYVPDLSSVANLHLLNLTEREMELLMMEARGMTIEDISAQTSLSKATIYTHRRNILQRSGHNSTLKLIEELREKGVI